MKLKIHPVLTKIQYSSIIPVLTRKGFQVKLINLNTLIILSK
jgi:hypothetical protein